MELLMHLVKANAVFALLFGAYLLVLRGETFFLANRAWLVGSTIIALLLPFVHWSTSLSPLAGSLLPTVLAGTDVGAPPSGLRWDIVLLFGYAVGVVFNLIQLVIDVRNAWIASGVAVSSEGFSFLGRVSIPHTLTGADREAMEAHEWAHVRHGHSLDVLLLRLVHAFNWFNPLWLLALRELRSVHEHTADAIACERHADYDHLLLAQALGVPSHALTNNFRSSNLKNRMTMLHRKPSSLAAGSKYLVALPLLFIALTIAAPLRSASPVRGVQNDVVTQAEQMPEFMGGMEALSRFIAQSIKYPEPLKPTGPNMPEGMTIQLEGTVMVQFVVDTDGSVRNTKVVRAAAPPLDEEALRVVNSMPRWTPGKNAGKTVPVQMVLPIKFKPA